MHDGLTEEMHDFNCSLQRYSLTSPNYRWHEQLAVSVSHLWSRAHEQNDDDAALLSIEADLQWDVLVAMRHPIHRGDS
jgi:hypothetical protein